MTLRPHVIIIALSGLAVAGAMFAGRSSVDAQAEARSLFRATVSLRSAEETPLWSPLPGETSIISIAPEGGRVARGEVVAQLDASSVEAEYHEAEIGREVALAALARTELEGEMAQEEAAARLSIAEAELDLAERTLAAEEAEAEIELLGVEHAVRIGEQRLVVANLHLEMIEEALRRDETPEGRLAREEAKLAVLESEVEWSQATARRKLVTEHDRTRRRAALELELAEKRLGVLLADRERALVHRRIEAEIGEGRGSVRRLEHRLDELRAMLDSARILAPADGIVIHPEGVRLGAGARIGDGEEILSIAGTDLMRVEVPGVPLETAKEVVPGQRASLRVHAFPDRFFEGRVTLIRLASEPDEPRPIAVITMEFAGEGSNWKPGLTAEVEILEATER